jgi:hypothetical protein
MGLSQCSLKLEKSTLRSRRGVSRGGAGQCANPKKSTITVAMAAIAA